jgi:hypothetical protein
MVLVETGEVVDWALGQNTLKRALGEPNFGRFVWSCKVNKVVYFG